MECAKATQLQRVTISGYKHMAGHPEPTELARENWCGGGGSEAGLEAVGETGERVYGVRSPITEDTSKQVEKKKTHRLAVYLTLQAQFICKQALLLPMEPCL